VRDIPPPPLLAVLFIPPPPFLAAAPDREAARPVGFLALALLEATRLEVFAARPPDCFFPLRLLELVAVRLAGCEPPPADFFVPRRTFVRELPDVVFRTEVPFVPPFRANAPEEDFATVLTAERLTDAMPPLVSSEPSVSGPSAEMSVTPES